MKLNPFRVDPAHPFQLAKFLSISSLVLILGSGLVLSVFITNHAKTALLKKNREFALLLAENLNHQIYRRFTLPVVLGFGKVELKRPDQYERLAQVVDSTVHSFHVLDVRVYNTEGEVVFDTTPELVGRVDLGGETVERAVSKGSTVLCWRIICRYGNPFFLCIWSQAMFSCARSILCGQNVI